MLERVKIARFCAGPLNTLYGHPTTYLLHISTKDIVKTNWNIVNNIIFTLLFAKKVELFSLNTHKYGYTLLPRAIFLKMPIFGLCTVYKGPCISILKSFTVNQTDFRFSVIRSSLI